MNPPFVPTVPDSTSANSPIRISQVSHQTAQDFIASQLSLEADAREALPYQFDTCTKPLGPLRQSVYACLTCTPPPASSHQQFTPAGVCYSCSISCHGEHNLVELFGKRDFVCDCGTTRIDTSRVPCALRWNAERSKKGEVRGDTARVGNKYNQNFQGRFCGCGEVYDAEKEKGTMFQCVGLGTVEDGGCGEDWWHPECIMKLPRKTSDGSRRAEESGALESVKEETDADLKQVTESKASGPHSPEDESAPPLGFPDEDDFDHLICYKCANAFPWIKQYASTPGFLTASASERLNGAATGTIGENSLDDQDTKKRKADTDVLEDSPHHKKVKGDDTNAQRIEAPPIGTPGPKHSNLPPAPIGDISLFLTENFRDYLCRCPECFPRLAKHRVLLEEEETYEPPLSESGEGDDGNGSVAGHSMNSGSLLDRGEAALSSMDRVRAIEGVMAYNHVRDKVKAFLQPFAESGQPVGAEDIKAYFAKLRGDEQGLQDAAVGAGGDGDVDNRREQSGY